MSRGGQKPGGGRTITSDEAALWEHATRTLDRVKAKPRVAAAREPSPPTSPPPPPAPTPTARSKPVPATSVAPRAAAIPKDKAKQAPAAPLAEFERRKARQIGSGKVELDARIDLHGLRQSDARMRLRAFLLDAHAQGYKTVLVITGKGGEEPADRLGELGGERQRGVLRRNVPSWLQEPDLRPVVLSYTQAGIRHGGTGALYVQLRRGAWDQAR